MPFNIPSVRIAQASPSISLERGSYRMRAPPSRTRTSSLRTAKNSPPLDQARSSALSGRLSMTEFVPASYEKRMALLVAFLCFNAASPTSDGGRLIRLAPSA
ncbi:hypothetical protein C8Q74DRAFT_1374333 [Fomes fomentarius]|nr:hypothetical protein C8Q74DRAFT_1374333 [Fomes fomentarius]